MYLKLCSRYRLLLLTLIVLLSSSCYLKRILKSSQRAFMDYMSSMSCLKMDPENVAIQSANLIHYPESQSFMECLDLIKSPKNVCELSQNIYYFTQYDRNEYKLVEDTQLTTSSRESIMQYSETHFRRASYPVLWLDAHGNVRWNRIAEKQMYFYLLDKQFPMIHSASVEASTNKARAYIKDCQSRNYILLQQWHSGFFSRVNSFIEQFGQSLYSPLMAILLPRKFNMASSGSEDFLGEGILGYIIQISRCSA